MKPSCLSRIQSLIEPETGFSRVTCNSQLPEQAYAGESISLHEGSESHASASARGGRNARVRTCSISST